MTKLGSLVAFAIALIAVAPSSAVAKGRTAKVIILVDAVRPPYAWGLFAVWTELFVRDEVGRRRVLYMPYTGEQEVLPKRGQRCTVRYRFDKVKGWVVRTPTSLRRAPVVVEINCLNSD